MLNALNSVGRPYSNIFVISGESHVSDFSLLLHRSYYSSCGTPVVRTTPALPKLAFIPQQQRVLFWNSWGRLDHQRACGRVENLGGNAEIGNREESDARRRLQRLRDIRR
jgi:hypothetical protein